MSEKQRVEVWKKWKIEVKAVEGAKIKEEKRSSNSNLDTSKNRQSLIAHRYLCQQIINTSKNCNLLKQYNTMSRFQQNLRKFKQKPKFLLISVRIDDQQYQLQVNQGHTIKDVIQRYQRSGHLSEQCNQEVYFHGKRENDSMTVSEMFKLMAQRNMKQLLIQIKQLPIQKQIKTKKPQNQAPQPIQPSPSPPTQAITRKQPTKADKQQQKPETETTDKITKWLNALINNNSSQLVIQKYAKEEQKKIFDLILKIQHQIIIKYTVCQDFMDTLVRKLGRVKGNEDFNGFRKKKSGKNVGSQINMFGDKQKNILQTVQNLLCYIQLQNPTSNQLKLQQTLSKMQETSQTQIKQIQNLKKQIEQLQFKIKCLEQQKMRQQYTKINRSLGATTINSTSLQNTTVDNSYAKNGIKLITSYVNRKQYADYFKFILGCLHKYEDQVVDTIQPLATFTNLYFESLPVLFDTLNVNSPNTRLIIILQTTSGQFLAFYSTNGIQKKVKQSPPSSPMKSKSSISGQQVTQPCKSGLGFLLQLQQRKQFSLPNHQDMKSLMWYDQKFLYITESLRIYKNLNKKLQLQFRTAQVQLIWGEDMGNSLEEKLKKLKKASEIKRMQVLKVNLSITDKYQRDDTLSQSFLINKDNLLPKYL